MKTALKTTVLSVLAAIAFTTANAQTSQTQTVTLNLSNKIDITLESGGTESTFDFTETSHYASGLTKAGAAEFQVKSNRPWKVTAATSTTHFSYTAPSGLTPSTLDANTSMPADVLSVKNNSGSKYESLSKDTPVEVGNGSRGNGTENKFKIDYEAKPGFAYDAGQYKINVVYTATQL